MFWTDRQLKRIKTAAFMSCLVFLVSCEAPSTSEDSGAALIVNPGAAITYTYGSTNYTVGVKFSTAEYRHFDGSAYIKEPFSQTKVVGEKMAEHKYAKTTNPDPRDYMIIKTTDAEGKSAGSLAAFRGNRETVEVDLVTTLAFQLFTEVLERAPSSAKEIEDAEEMYRKAIKINPKISKAYYNLGNLVKNKGFVEDEVEAERMYRKAIELNPKFSDAYHNLGKLLKVKGLDEEADRYFKIAKENYVQ